MHKPSLSHPVLDQSQALRAKAFVLRLWCPEPQFLGWNRLHRFLCERGHEFRATPARVVRTLNCCPECQDEHSIEQLRAKAAELGIECLDERWLGRSHPYRFRCGCGHEWRHRPSMMACPKCFAEPKHKPRREINIDTLRQLAADRGGVCLSEAYHGSRQCYHMRCANGHEWHPEGARVLAGQWCARCASDARRVNLGVAIDLARQHRGLCLSSKCTSGTAELFWRCEREHVWGASLHDVRNGRWCQECEVIEARESSPLNLDQLRHE